MACLSRAEYEHAVKPAQYVIPGVNHLRGTSNADSITVFLFQFAAGDRERAGRLAGQPRPDC